MAEEVKDLRRLVIKAFHMNDVEWGEHNDITVDGNMTVSKEMIDQLVAQEEHIEKIDIQIIKPVSYTHLERSRRKRPFLPGAFNAYSGSLERGV